MKSVIIVSVCSFFVIFAGTFWIMGVFAGGGESVAEIEVAEAESETGLAAQGIDELSRTLEVREGDVLEMESAVEVEKAVLAEEYNKLEALCRRLDDSMGQVEEAQLKSVKKLAKMYEAMPAKEAASILSGMDLEIVLGVLRQMKDRQAAKVMAALDPSRAAALSGMMSSGTGAP